MNTHMRSNSASAFGGQHICSAHEEHLSCSQLIVPYMYNNYDVNYA